jgi:PTH1 family peptidyl-tRNA hydrolase
MGRPAARERTGTPADFVVVGLGNPGSEYAKTRHNVGFDVIEALAARHGARLKKGKELALVDEVRIDGKRVALAIPTTYMNESGQSVAALVRRFGVDPEQLIVVHDELDLPVGALRLKEGGGLAGHNGLRSIKAHLKTDTFLRVRVGVGKPVSKEQGANYVLARFGSRERVTVDATVGRAADAIACIVDMGIATAMNRFNE